MLTEVKYKKRRRTILKLRFLQIKKSDLVQYWEKRMMMRTCIHRFSHMAILTGSRVAKCHKYGRYICVKFVKVLESNICAFEVG